MNIIRIIKAFKGITDRYEASFECSKELKPALDFIRSYQGKGLYRAGKLRVVEDTNQGGFYEIELQVQAREVGTNRVLNILEVIRYQIFYRGNVVYRVSINLKAVDSKKTYEEFQAAFNDALPTVEAQAAPAPVPAEEEKIDLSDKTMLQALDIFDKSVAAFGNDVSAKTFATVKATKAEISKKIDALDIKERAAYMACMSKVDTFISAINMQFSNPAMAASVAGFAGTYVSQIRAEIASMIALAS